MQKRMDKALLDLSSEARLYIVEGFVYFEISGYSNGAIS
jgi:hypothetical protein